MRMKKQHPETGATLYLVPTTDRGGFDATYRWEDGNGDVLAATDEEIRDAGPLRSRRQRTITARR